MTEKKKMATTLSGLRANYGLIMKHKKRNARACKQIIAQTTTRAFTTSDNDDRYGLIKFAVSTKYRNDPLLTSHWSRLAVDHTKLVIRRVCVVYHR